MMTIDGRSARILLVEDNPGDVRLIREALTAGRISHQLSVVSDAEEALDFLQRRGKHAAKSLPDLVLLDLNLPRLNGLGLLRAIKDDEVLRQIPAVVFTTSSDRRDIAASYGLGANAFVTKPIDLDQFIAAIQSIEEFWLRVAARPTET